MPVAQVVEEDENEPTPSCAVAYLDARHSEKLEVKRSRPEPWRVKERMKTVSVALTLCLNIGVDPPDVVKPQPCARLECGLDPMAMSQQKALEMIGAALQKQYERWQPRARYKLSLDPTVEDVKKLCTSLRRNAKDERVLFHYNGHGVPKPTKNGEIWVFNKSYTQYIPLSLYDLQTWMGAPSIYVWDCNCAGMVVECFNQFAEQHEKEMHTSLEFRQRMASNGSSAQQPSRRTSTAEAPMMGGMGDETSDDAPAAYTSNFRDCIQLGACQVDQILPMNPELPADMFTSCLTTPIKAAVMWYILQNNLTEQLPIDIVDKIPGQLTERRTLLGELNWIFTAITDTIAWNTLPRDLFQKLFRQDLLVAGLFRNFLLADRIMRSYNCTPISSPELPSAAEHPMWQAWDSALDVCLSQMSLYLPRSDAAPVLQPVPSVPLSQSGVGLSDLNVNDYTHSPFFASQLTAFEVWLQYGYDHRGPPQQLPIVLQVLLSQVHRARALELLGRFLDLGSWAVSLALSVGIFPYVLKLLLSPAKELRPLLSFIWAKILAVDGDCQVDLVKDGGHRYFLQILSDPATSFEQKIVPAFAIAAILDDYVPGQEAIMQGGFMSICMDLLNDCRNSLLNQWLAIGLGRLWSNFDPARWQGMRCLAYEKLYDLLQDPVPEVRAGAVYALGTLISNRTEKNDHAIHTEHSIAMNLSQKMRQDASPLVRQELVVALHWLVLNFENQFVTIAYELREERDRWLEEQQKQMKARNNGSIVHHRQSSLSIADNVNSDLLVASGNELHRQSSVQNIAASSSATLTPKRAEAKMTSASSFTKLFMLVSSSTSKASDAAKEMSMLEHRLRDMQLRGLGGSGNVYLAVWRVILELIGDPHPDVSTPAKKVFDYINAQASELRNLRRDAEERNTATACSTLRRHSMTTSIPTSTPGATSSDHTPASLETEVSAVLRPKFVVGSPSDNTGSPSAAMLSPKTVLERRTRLNTPRSGTAATALVNIADANAPSISFYSAIYTSPRRPMFGSGPEQRSESEQSESNVSTSEKKLPLIKTDLVPWLAKRFTQPILHFFNDESAREEPRQVIDAPLSDWALETLEATRDTAGQEWRSLVTRNGARLDMQVFVNRSPRTPSVMQFLPLYPLLVVGETYDISIWNWRTGQFVTSFPNGSMSASYQEKLCSMFVVNPATHGFLLSGTVNGQVRVFDCNLAAEFDIFGSHDTGNERPQPRLVTAWTTTNDVARFNVNPQTEYFWEQESALLFVGGDFKSLRVWDARREQKIQEFTIGNDQRAVTSISADYQGHSLVAVGTADGDVRVYDRRVPPDENRIMKLRDLDKPIVKVHLQRRAVGSQLVAASENGEIRVWDPRMFQDPVVTCRLDDGSPSNCCVTAADVHEQHELMGLATNSHTVHVMYLNGKPLNTIRYHDGFMGQRLNDVQCLKFHPYRPILALGGADNVLAVYGSS